MESLDASVALIGRSGLVREVVRCLHDPTKSGALILGGTGTGKSAVATAVVRELRPHWPYIRLVATPALARVPFGVLAPHLAGLPVHELDSYSAVLRAMTSSLRSKSWRPLFVIENAQSLDRGTIKLVVEAVATGAAGVLATSGPGTLLPEDFLALWDDGIVEKYELAALSQTEAHQLCARVLRADVSPWASASLSHLAMGNPFMLLSLIDHARRTGALALKRGTWFLLSEPVLTGFPAADLVHHRLAGMPPEAERAATVVSLAGPLSVREVLSFCNPQSIDALERAGIIEVSGSGGRVVRPGSPLIGEILRRRVPAGRSAVLRASLQALPRTGRVQSEAFRNQVRWALDCGAHVCANDLLQAAELANVALDPKAALRAADVVRDESHLPRARVQAAYAQFTAGLPLVASELLQQATAQQGYTPSELAESLAARLHTALGGARSSSGRSVATGLTAGDPESSWADVEHGLRARLEAAQGQRETYISVASLLAQVWSAQGRINAGLDLDRQAWLEAQTNDLSVPLVYEDLLLRHCLTLTWAGEWGLASTAVDHYAASFPSRLLRSGGMLHALRGFSRARQGRMPEGLADLFLAVEELKTEDPWQLLPFAHSVAAYAAASVGDRHTASQSAEQFRRLHYGEPRVFGLLAEAYCAVAENPPNSDELQRALSTLSKMAQNQGLRSIETEIRRIALARGDTREAAALAMSSSAVDGPEAVLVHNFARSVQTSDVVGLIRIGDSALAAGYLLLSLESAQQAERCLANAQDKRPLLAVRRRVQNRLTTAGMSAHLGLVRSGLDTLSAREEQVLNFVIGGASNSTIAVRLGVSQRTVEGHLYKIFAKLGVGRRSDLLQAGTARKPK